MEEKAEKSSSSGKRLIILGFVTIGILFLLYSRYQDSELLTPSAIESIQRIAYGFYITLVASFGAIAFGMYRYHKEKVENKGNINQKLTLQFIMELQFHLVLLRHAVMAQDICQR
jgi:hypothetical protein